MSWFSPVIANILVVETGERFAFFGFRAILVLYFTRSLGFSDQQAISLFAFTTCLAYLSPLAGALTADGCLGRYWTILSFGLVYVTGLAIVSMAASAPTGSPTTTAGNSDPSLRFRRVCSFLGLFLVCLGTGGIKPCVSSFGADQITLRVEAPSSANDFQDRPETASVIHEKEDDGQSFEPNHVTMDVAAHTIERNTEEHTRQYFAWFYFCINVGALTSIAIIPIIREHVGFGAAFSTSFIVMVTAMILFVSRRREYKHNPRGSTLTTTFVLCWWWIRHYASSVPFLARFCKPGPPQAHGHSISGYTAIARQEQHSHDDRVISGDHYIRDETCLEHLIDAAQVVRILPVLACLPLYWSLYDQQASVWTLQAARMGLMGIQPEQMTLVNPLEIMIFIPLFDQLIYPAMTARGIRIDPLRRLVWGMVLAAVSFLASSWVEDAISYRLANGLPPVNVLWQLPQLTILAISEIFLSVTSLEFAYAKSPERLKTFVTSLYLLTTAVGNLIGGLLYSTVFANMPLASVMRTCAFLMVLNLGLFLLVKRNWDRHALTWSRSLQGMEFQERQTS